MKLIFCLECQDVFKPATRLMTYCKCTKCSGQHIDENNLEYSGPGIPVGFANSTFARAIRNRPESGDGAGFTAFIFPEQCDSIVKLD